MQSNVCTIDALREYVRSMGSEPSDFINSLAESIGQSVWLCNQDFDIVWGSHSTKDILSSAEVYEGSGYVIGEGMRDFLKGISKATECRVQKGVYTEDGRELGLTVLPVVKEGVAMGYIVTVAEGIGAKLTGMLERQRKREKLYNEQC